MIKKIQIKKYQSHRNTEISLSSGITGIIGLSNTGKTAIRRAFEWLCFNRPAGFNFNSNFAKKKETRVRCELEDGTLISLQKGKGTQYKIAKLDLKDKPVVFRKFGRAIPDLVQQKLNIQEINIQQQMDEPFLITSSPGKIAEAINKATKIDRVGFWIKKTNAKIYKRKTKLGIVEEDIKEVKDDLKLLEPLEKIGEKIRVLQKLENKIEKKTAEHVAITGHIIGIQQLRIDLKEAEQALKVKDKIVSLQETEENIESILEEFNLIVDIKEKKKEIKLAVKEHKKYVRKYLKAIKESGECPTCFGQLTHKVIKRIKNEISIS